jgi:hypothetical protein
MSASGDTGLMGVLVALDGGVLVVTIIVTAAICIPAMAVGLRLSHKLFPQAERTPAQEAVVRRLKRLVLGYCLGLLVLAGILWWATGNVFEAIGITLAIMVVAQFVISGLITHKKTQLRNPNSGRST